MLLTLQFLWGHLPKDCKVTGPEVTLAASLERAKVETAYMILQWLEKISPSRQQAVQFWTLWRVTTHGFEGWFLHSKKPVERPQHCNSFLRRWARSMSFFSKGRPRCSPPSFSTSAFTCENSLRWKIWCWLLPDQQWSLLAWRNCHYWFQPGVLVLGLEGLSDCWPLKGT